MRAGGRRKEKEEKEEKRNLNSKQFFGGQSFKFIMGEVSSSLID